MASIIILLEFKKLNVLLCVCNDIQAIPEEMEFDPNSTPPCYKTEDSVSYLPYYYYYQNSILVTHKGFCNPRGRLYPIKNSRN